MGTMSFIEAVGTIGVVVFAVSGALAAGRQRMDPVGYILLGTITAIGGGTVRDLILGQPVFWIHTPGMLVLAMVAALATYFVVPEAKVRKKWIEWSDAAGLAAFSVLGTLIAHEVGVHPVVAVVMGMLTATGGGIIRDVMTGDRLMVASGQLYVSTALAGSATVMVMLRVGTSDGLAAGIGFAVVLLTRGASLLFNIRMGPPGESLRAGD